MNKIKIYPKITVVTPNFNQVDFIEQTIQSVLNQNYPNLEYIIIDGGSTDGSVDIINNYSSQLFYWISKPDRGMYDAINTGFAKSTGEIMCWINSDDILWKNSLYYVASAFTQNLDMHWLQGFPTVIDEQGELIYKRPHVYSKFYFYLLKHEQSFHFIQQESTFWRRSLWENAGGNLSLEYALASDFDLWLRFFNYENMYCTTIPLGAFRKRYGQKSGNKELYLREARNSIHKNIKKLYLKDRLVIQLIFLLEKINSKLHSNLIGRFINNLQSSLIGKAKMINTP